MPTKEVAAKLGILPQTPIAPEGITVADLVSRGRHPHQTWLRQWSARDEAVVVEAMRVTGTVELAERPVDELSGGQRQRAWIAMALAQDTDLMLLDEPTTYLDLAHQIDVLDLLVDLNRAHGRTIVLVLHDLNQAARYSDHLVAMKGGAVVASGRPGRGDHRGSRRRRLRPVDAGRGRRGQRYAAGAIAPTSALRDGPSWPEADHAARSLVARSLARRSIACSSHARARLARSQRALLEARPSRRRPGAGPPARRRG